MSPLSPQKRIRKNLLHWFFHYKRNLPWRREPRDPYHVWLSEVMLQQTQVATVIPYYERWLQRFPTLHALAEAPLDDVLKQWEGLGYYSRARNFHKAAQTVVGEMGGGMPRTVDTLLMLPGVGRYTASAIASLAFNQHAAVLDGNVKRVLARIYALSEPTDDDLWMLAEALLPQGQAGAFNEALMELGATVCTPRSPKCSLCPISKDCAALASGTPEAFPAKRAKAATPHYDVLTAIVLNTQQAVLMGQRPRDGLLGGLWEFVSSEFRMASGELGDVVRERTGLIVDDEAAEMIGTVKHAFTHFKITRHVFVVARIIGMEALADSRLKPPFQKERGYAQLHWVPLNKIRQLALTRSDQKIFALYEKHRLSLLA